ncbi:MAG: hypothetical protein ACOX1S_05530 [Anaerostipes sp.]|nr:hypothetical protein [Anaerostipes sp.]
MKKIPKAKSPKSKRISPENIENINISDKVVFSFSAIDKNEYFNLDATCENWSLDLFDTMKKISDISLKDIYAKKYSGKSSPFRIHQHDNAKPPCDVPKNILIDDMWQIRISRSKGGIHGIFTDNIFYVIWFDPHHNLYPDDHYGGLTKIKPQSNCCKERELIIEQLKAENQELKKEKDFWEECYEKLECNKK